MAISSNVDNKGGLIHISCMNAVEIFTGAGGLAISLTKAGVSHKALIELNKDSCDTLRQNQNYLMSGHKEINIFQGDARLFNYRSISAKIDIVAGGPPCQPFSLGGKHKGYEDKRDMFPEAVRAVRELQPKAFLFENVKGLTRNSFRYYFEYILLQLSYPCVARKPDETWLDHKKHLIKHERTSAKINEIRYKVAYRVLNAADFGVPQKRERIFFVGIRNDLNTIWSFPETTHSYAALLKSKWITNEYWKKHGIKRWPEKQPSEVFLTKLASDFFIDDKAPWQTIRDAIGDLPDPRKVNGIKNHEFRGGAKQYAGHTGSEYDEPAKTLKAGVHGVPGGENMFISPSGTTRYFTTREAARIQTFPDEYVFPSSWTESMRQIGNAVPVKLGEIIINSLIKALRKNEHSKTLQSA